MISTLLPSVILDDIFLFATPFKLRVIVTYPETDNWIITKNSNAIFFIVVSC